MVIYVNADDHHGFNAVVKRIPIGHHVAPVAKVVPAPIHVVDTPVYHHGHYETPSVYTKVSTPSHYYHH